MAESLIGVGLAFPMRLDPSGSIALVTRETKIEQSIRLILATAHGERPMRPDFGSGVHNYVFSADDAVTAGRLAFEVRTALERWEPRIDLVDVSVAPDDTHGDGCLVIDVAYVVRGTNDPRNLVFPFYVIPSEARS
jgi:phage baseplate assembly protein W